MDWSANVEIGFRIERRISRLHSKQSFFEWIPKFKGLTRQSPEKSRGLPRDFKLGPEDLTGTLPPVPRTSSGYRPQCLAHWDAMMSSVDSVPIWKPACRIADSMFARLKRKSNFHPSFYRILKSGESTACRAKRKYFCYPWVERIFNIEEQQTVSHRMPVVPSPIEPIGGGKLRKRLGLTNFRYILLCILLMPEVVQHGFQKRKYAVYLFCPDDQIPHWLELLPCACVSQMP